MANGVGAGVRNGNHDATRAARLDTSTVLVSTPVYVLVWWLVLVLHGATAVFVLVGAVVHLVLSLPTVDANTAALLIPVALKRITGIAYLVVGLLHLAALVRMVVVSFRGRSAKLQLSKRVSVRSRSVRFTADELLGATASTSPLHRLQRAASRVFGVEGVLGLNGDLFLPNLLLRELVEIAMQSYQLWCLSYYVSRAWLNRFAVATVVLNCVSIPLVRLMFRKREHVQRLMHLVVDMYLDFACGVVVPVCVMLPYLQSFDWTKGEFPLGLLADDVWFSNAVAESRHVLVTSYLDFVASLLPQYSIYSCLRLIKRIVRQRPVRSRRVALASLTSAKPETTEAREAEALDHERQQPTRQARVSMRLVSACIVVWGVCVAGFHLAAERQAGIGEFPGCQLYVRPWLATQVACSVLYVNCYRRNIAGLAVETGDVLDQIEPSVLTKLVFMHCPALTIPDSIVRFFSLGSIEIINATLVAWPAQATIRQQTHPRLVNLYITGCNVSGVPHGLLHRELPLSLLTIGFTNSTIAELPVDLGELWATSRLGRLALDGTQIRSLPASLGRLRFRRLWMARTPVNMFPTGLFSNSTLLAIRLSDMPLKELPASVGDTSKLKELVVERTNVSVLPAWAIAWLDAHQSVNDSTLRSFYGSSVCDSLATSLKTTWRICEQELQSPHGFTQESSGLQRYPL